MDMYRKACLKRNLSYIKLIFSDNDSEMSYSKCEIEDEVCCHASYSGDNEENGGSGCQSEVNK